MEKLQLPELVRLWRKVFGYNTKQAGEILGVSPRTIEGIEQGKPFRHEQLLRLALAYVSKKII